MYQFPKADEVMGEHDPEPYNNPRSRYKIIIIGNLLLALFVGIGVWFLYVVDSTTPFAKSDSVNIAGVTKKLSTGDFTPIVIEGDEPQFITTETSKDTISSITKSVQNTPITESYLTANTVKKIGFNSDKKAGEATHQSQPSKTFLAVEAITKELMKGKQAKVSTVKPKISASKQVITIKPRHKSPVIPEKKQLKKNQIIIEQTTSKALTTLINKSQKNLTHSDQILVKRLSEVDSAQHNHAKDTISYNSVPFKKANEIDKIMAAMNGIKKSKKISATEKLELKIKKLLKNQANIGNTYVKQLLPESEENKKEGRTLTVKQGEKLWDISVRAYGDGNQYKKIIEANPLLKENPKLLKAGITLRVPL